MQLKLSMGDQSIWVTVIKIEDNNVFFKVKGEDEIYFQSLCEERASTFSIGGNIDG